MGVGGLEFKQECCTCVCVWVLEDELCRCI